MSFSFETKSAAKKKTKHSNQVNVFFLSILFSLIFRDSNLLRISVLILITNPNYNQRIIHHLQFSVTQNHANQSRTVAKVYETFEHYKTEASNPFKSVTSSKPHSTLDTLSHTDNTLSINITSSPEPEKLVSTPESCRRSELAGNTHNRVGEDDRSHDGTCKSLRFG
ncbi:hypothetical protein HanXRQr2_Chr13g0583251 [Helianthus annuus]|uniref:Uncharacterized protein n=1 Tax=Helianthus annuus TaxID=4232 RepID=A0A251SQL4_HELAN|nr:hypothetical protein HanXRQr2_Chr13g0583251 [Helianthus annuus]KAJ0848774.1 hypothetical protein HanPSC8_Chr13g0561391 [Helianthus annuus]